MSTHTPGPWKVLATARSRFFGVLRDERKPGKPLKAGDVAIIAARIGSRDDARLIAAAPRMLDTLRRIANETCDHGAGFCPRDEARAILRDVEGESHG